MLICTIMLNCLCSKEKQPPEAFCKKGVLKNFAMFTAKHVLESLFNKVAYLKACNLIKKRLQHGCFPVNIAKFLRNTYFEEHIQTAASIEGFKLH